MLAEKEAWRIRIEALIKELILKLYARREGGMAYKD
jgi:hypothetical protein